MQIFKTVEQLRAFVSDQKQRGNKIGLVPTMGALHEGHIQLIKAALAEGCVTICSIFVNPIQFNNATDLEKYPRTLETDCKLLEMNHCHGVFAPEVSTIYAVKPELAIDFGYQNTVMEGAFRPGHFSGVGVIVAKLFNLVQPDLAFFGQKDFQQCLVVKQLVQDLSFPVTLKIIDTVREEDGLAMSSRNKRLDEAARAAAPKIYQSLLKAAELSGSMALKAVKEEMLHALSKDPLIKPEYLEFVDFETGKVVDGLEPGHKYGICVAAMVGNVRLIDNIIINS